MTRGHSKGLVDFNPEPERVIRRYKKEEKFKAEASSTSLGEEAPKEEMNIQEEDPVGDPPPPHQIVQNRGRMDGLPRTNLDYSRPDLQGITSSVVRPRVQANNFEIKPSMIKMVQDNAQFEGLQDEDPTTHVRLFLELCDTFKFNGVREDAKRLRLFPFSLRGKARQWLGNLPNESITTWDDLLMRFMDRYFPPS